ncbi:hypothetical protein L0B53_14905 [Vibrio sp. SS-MA-C1-2]|uniref:hypothetical protein n=1 Tax=Vibrio sp. SS-MA-C1-2 TaxID=2908646 RepID=UPI001F2F3BB0|nr:hypothetical protein [Vibrio sp. SS-MA-C1-2]UJF18297.1 hypothetical protein L0B53_14905 [Vibrio sp. SS-MA-C1-2]
MKNKIIKFSIAASIPFLLSSTTMAADNSGEMSLAQAAKKSANPVSDAWMLVAQNDYTTLKTRGGGHEMQNRFSFQPVMPVPIMDGEWNLVNRMVLQQYSSPGQGVAEDSTPSDIFADGRTNGLGDTVFMSLAAPNRDDGWIWGVGPTMIAPTATEDNLGQEKWQVGPAALVARLGSESGDITSIDSWNLGILAQQWWSFAGTSNRKDTSQSDIQYFINYKVNDTGLIGMTPNISIDWKKHGKDRFNVPVGLGYIGMARIGQMPVRWGVEAQYYVMRSDTDDMTDLESWDADSIAYTPQFNLKVFVAPIAKNPFK